MARDEDTICAIATPPGSGGVALIRVSGKEALTVSRRVCPFLPNILESHKIYYGFALDNLSGERLDEVLASYFATGRSFTGEETVEVSCHGGSLISKVILQSLIDAGARLADKGEFTYRAFLSGRIDLIQAESVLALIESQSRRSSRVALRQLSGYLSKFIDELEESLHWVVAHLEANIDFAHEDIEAATTQELEDRLEQVLEGARKAIRSYSSGKILKEGFQVALVGRPNVGKSSLLNRLIGEEKSIVTDIPGTTRDQVEGCLFLDGVQVNIVDTAGLRETIDTVELIGIERTKAALKAADLVWLLVDLSKINENEKEDFSYLSELDSSRVWLIGHKSDQVSREDSSNMLRTWWKAAEVEKRLNWDREPLMVVGHSMGDDGLVEILSLLKSYLSKETSEDSVVLIQARHQELFNKISMSLEAGLSLLRENESPEFIAFELREALMGLYELRGKQFDVEVLDRVFKEFCLGK